MHFLESGRTLQYAEIAGLVSRMRSELGKAGAGPGSVVGLLAVPGPGFLAAFFGALAVGAAVSVLPIHAGTSADTSVAHLHRIIAAAGIRYVAVSKPFEVVAGGLREREAGLRFFQCDDLEPRDGTISLLESDPAATAIVQFSSGTTGVPRGVELSHSAVLANISAIVTSLEVNTSDYSQLSWVPLFHDLGLMSFLASIAGRGSLYRCEPMTFLRDPGKISRWLSELRINYIGGPNFAYEYFVENLGGGSARADLSNLHSALNGGEFVRAETLQRFADATAAYGAAPTVMRPAYGMAENCAGITLSPCGVEARVDWFDRELLAAGKAHALGGATESARAIVSVGIPVPGTSVRIVDESRNAVLEHDQVGEIEFTGDSLMSGYLRDQQATVAAHRGGWFRTGDRGFVHEGHLFLCGRTKDMITVRGRNFYAEDVEMVVTDAIGDVVPCVAFTDLYSDRERMIILVEAAAEKERLRRIEARLSGALGLTSFEVHGVRRGWIPRTTSGKARRAAARDRFARRAERD
ncbi:AMP-binding protein [Nocardia goodfellowii]|uniref:AMP-binding protein n=1 Tax=Nocardia goodfellowii TaxID=882446 RepID=UPI001AE1F25F|nr:AMP-binding protein [Nocardia goodfellowii]